MRGSAYILTMLLASGCARSPSKEAPKPAEPEALAKVEPATPRPAAAPAAPAMAPTPAIEVEPRLAADGVRMLRRGVETAAEVDEGAEVALHIPQAVENAERPALLRAIYEAGGSGPLLTDGLAPSDHAVALEALLKSPLAPAADPVAAAALDVRLVSAVVDAVLEHRFVYKAHPALKTEDVAVLVEERQADIATIVAAVLPDVAAGLKALEPRNPLYGRIRVVLPKYRALAEKADPMPTFHVDWRTRTIETGWKTPKVGKLQKRLRWQGYYDGPTTNKLDEPTMAAVRAFQEDHQLNVDGQPGKSTFRAMNVPMKVRVQQLETSLQRLREHRPTREGATDYLYVNLPGFTADRVEGGQVKDRRRVIVGNNKLDYNREQWRQGHLNRTPLMKTRLYKLVLNPVWIIPKRIRDSEISEATVARKRLREVSSRAGSSYLIQGPGKANALGRIKFLLEDTNAVYLHDTDKRYLFDRSERAMSHGCMRVQHAVELGKELARARAGMDAETFDRILATGHTRVIELETPLTVYTDYLTVGLKDDGGIVFYEDIYGYDAAYARGEAPRRWTRYGSPAMKPRGVPRIPFREYLKLKRKGGAAPEKWPLPTTSDS